MINFILNLPPSKRRKILSDVFSLSTELIEFDFVEEVIEELTKLKEELTNYSPQYNPPEDTLAKIERNFTGEDIEIVKRKFTHFYAEHIGYLQKVLESFDSDFISNLKMTILNEYQALDKKNNF